MKAIYKTPQIRIVQISTAGLIAASPKLGFDENPVGAGEARSKRSLWYDDEDEE